MMNGIRKTNIDVITIHDFINHCEGNKSQAARKLRIHKNTLYNILNKNRLAMIIDDGVHAFPRYHILVSNSKTLDMR